MKTKNAMQLKAMVKKVAKDKSIAPQLALQNYVLERILARIEASPYRDNFILKGGFLIGSMVGIDSRTTMDLDTTITGLTFTEQQTRQIFEDICAICLDDDMTFRVDYVTEIRDVDEYPGLRVAFKADYEKMSVPLTIDVTTGDVITPSAVETIIPTMFDEGFIRINAYNMETVLAEKIETILSRAEANTRPRDFYDVFILYKLWKSECNLNLLKLALERTSSKRGSISILKHTRSILNRIRASDSLRENWGKYRRTNTFAKDISYEQTCDVLVEILTELDMLETQSSII